MIEMTIDSIRVSLMNYQRVVILKEKESDRYLPIWIGPAEADAIAVKLQGIAVPRPLSHDLLEKSINNLGVTIKSINIDDLKNDTFFAKILIQVDQIVSTVKKVTKKRQNVEEEYVLFEWGKKFELLFMDEWQESGKKFIKAKSDTGDIFIFSNIDLTNNWILNEIHLDSRPSDALALAVRTTDVYNQNQTIPIFADESVLDKAGIMLDGETGKPIFDEKDEIEGKHGKVSDEDMKKKMSAFYDFINTLDLDDFDKRKS